MKRKLMGFYNLFSKMKNLLKEHIIVHELIVWIRCVMILDTYFFFGDCQKVIYCKHMTRGNIRYANYNKQQNFIKI